MIEEGMEEFVVDMFLKLGENEHKGQMFRDKEFNWLLNRMLEEFRELHEAIKDLKADPTSEHRRAVQKECADVANFAAMIHINAKDKEN